ncbi:MAG TPA: hypothetical protein VFP50_20595 [Anaeromyxobacteraceae bacterium]|nr:hypothetical protein [Anaeromyxobacteraceae bacterium]
MFLVGVALALPSHEESPPASRGQQAAACTGELELPPGHPPIDGLLGAPGHFGLSLPPGHPPADGRGAGIGRAAPQAPIFEEPKVLDI